MLSRRPRRAGEPAAGTLLKSAHLVLGPLVAVISLGIAKTLGMPIAAAWMLATVIWVGWWWITEALPLAITSLLPFVLTPLGGILDYKEASTALGDHIIVLFMAAFMLAKAVEVSGVHRRLALNMVSLIGASNGKLIILAFMVASAVLSMWISNTAAVLALLPVALALAEVSEQRQFQRALLLGLAYSASLGGIATLIGSPPNLIFASVYENYTGDSFGFTRWMGVGFPITLIGLPLIGWWLTRGVSLSTPIALPKPDTMSSQERRVLSVFGAVVLLWVLRTEPLGGWTGWFSLPGVGDSTIALMGVLAMFIISNGKGQRLLNWDQAVDIPWGILLLFAGGMCMAEGVMASGLSEIMGAALASFTQLPLWLLVFLIGLSVSFLTEVTSNTATATLLMPILAAIAAAAELPIEVLMIPAVIACSCAFCLPIATPPNSIVFSSNRITIKEMAKEGFVLNILMAAVSAAVVLFIV
ncbi:sodium:dicarboxylate symporter [Aliidiomarina taiwanensis]|uniref:Sodium:dicarboxylate symporter n=1 Tax=Aliidiomarina taiwanensis TaxID=946228 RepID=A0A432X084_9GAMM|nr:SLC13 family permease [Aliidiomarina taiwanensis]RUO39388.1 sodium:dicarboxylate symporter [Aliidiomarina taiwanensis]